MTVSVIFFKTVYNIRSSEEQKLTKVLGSRETFLEADKETSMEFLRDVSDIVQIEEYEKLKEYTHHRSTTRYQHCLNVAWYSFLWAKGMGLDAKSAARGGMLHDFYLYDSNEEYFKKMGVSHIALHPKIALQNAEKYLVLNETEKDCILNHMWPLGDRKPETKEGYVVCMADKYCASLEWGHGKAEKIVPIVKEIFESLDEN